MNDNCASVLVFYNRGIIVSYLSFKKAVGIVELMLTIISNENNDKKENKEINLYLYIQ